MLFPFPIPVEGMIWDVEGMVWDVLDTFHVEGKIRDVEGKIWDVLDTPPAHLQLFALPAAQRENPGNGSVPGAWRGKRSSRSGTIPWVGFAGGRMRCGMSCGMSWICGMSSAQAAGLSGAPFPIKLGLSWNPWSRE